MKKRFKLLAVQFLMFFCLLMQVVYSNNILTSNCNSPSLINSDTAHVISALSNSNNTGEFCTGFGKILPEKGLYDLSFQYFLYEYQNAIKNKDAEYIYSILDDDVEITRHHDERLDYGKEAFKLDYNLYDTNCEFWKTQNKLFAWEGEQYFDKGLIHYIFPSRRINDAFEYRFGNIGFRFGDGQSIFAVVGGTGVYVYKNPDPHSEILGILNYEIVKSGGYDDKFRMCQISCKDGKKGYISLDDLYEELDYFIDFYKFQGVWKIKMFICYDI